MVRSDSVVLSAKELLVGSKCTGERRSVPVANDRLRGESQVEKKMSLFGVIASVVKRGEHAVENGAQVFGGALDRAARGAGHVAKNVAHEAGHVAKNVVKQDVKGFKKIGHAVEDGGKVFGGALDRVARGAGHMAE